MKSGNIIIVCIVISTIFIQSCHKGSMWGIRGEGDTVSETRSLTGFTAVDLSIEADVSYVQDSVYSVEISAQRNILSILETKVKGETLIMDFKRNVWKHNDVYIVIHSPGLNRLQLSGSGNINVLNNISVNSLNCTISGSGNISVSSVSVQSLELKISGSGNINVNNGSCKNANYSISSSGTIKTENLITENANTSISGSGNILLNCTNSLQANISGSGNISYRGNPTVTKNISGSGQLLKLD